MIGLAVILIPLFVVFIGQQVNFQFYLAIIFMCLVAMVPFGAFLIAYPLAGEKRSRAKLVFLLTSIALVIPGILSRLELFTIPFTAIFLTVGIFWYCFAYAPLQLLEKYRKWYPYSKSKIETITLSSLDFIGLNLLAIYALVRFMHWPGGPIIGLAGVITLATGILAWNFKFKKEIVRRKKAEDTIKHQFGEIQDSIRYAYRIQSAILPPNKLVKEYLQSSFILYKPKDIVAGDFYWLEPTKDGVLFAAADCTGHGVPGAMVSVVCNNGLNRSVREHGLTDPGQILDKTREIVISEFEKSEEEVKDGMDIALCSLQGNTLKYAGAHNPLWIIQKDAQEVEEIKANKQPIGKFDEPLPYTTHTVELNEGDSFYIFSDGYADQFGGEKGKKLKAKNFKSLLLSIQNETMEKQRELIDEAFEK